VQDGNVVSAVHAVMALSSDKPGTAVAATSAQHVEIIQRNGHTEVREHRTNDKES